MKTKDDRFTEDEAQASEAVQVIAGLLMWVLIIWAIVNFSGCSNSEKKWHKETAEVVSCGSISVGIFWAGSSVRCRIKTTEGNYYTSRWLVLEGEELTIFCRNDHCDIGP